MISRIVELAMREGWPGFDWALRRKVAQQQERALSHLETRALHFQSLLNQITFPNYAYEAKIGGGAIYLQITCAGTCNVTGNPMSWKSGKWLLSPYMLDSEVVQKALKATLTAVEHEAREQFHYKGRAIFDPHYDVEKLWELRGQDRAVVQRELSLREPEPAFSKPLYKDLSHLDMAYGVMSLPTRDSILRAGPENLRTMEERVAKRLRNADDRVGTVVSGSLAQIHKAMDDLEVAWSYDKYGDPLPAKD